MAKYVAQNRHEINYLCANSGILLLCSGSMNLLNGRALLAVFSLDESFDYDPKLFFMALPAKKLIVFVQEIEN